MMSRVKRVIIFLVFLVCSISTFAEAVILPVPGNLQRQTQWCWASSAESIAEWLGHNVDQCVLADELRTASGWGWDQCCNYGYRTLLKGHVCNKGNWLFYNGSRPIEDMLAARNIGTQGQWSRLSQTAVQTEINAGRPFVMRWDWATEGAHTLVGRGQQGSTTFYFDPWDGFKSANYNWVASASGHHSWTRTLLLTTAPAPPVTDVTVNGQSGTYYAYANTNLDINGRLTDGLYAGTAADWWVVAAKDGVYAYLDRYGNWTTTPTPWKQGPLVDQSFDIFWGKLSVGTWYVAFGVDLNQDGVLNDPLYYDYVTIVVR